jgi:hypothetical protein
MHLRISRGQAQCILTVYQHTCKVLAQCYILHIIIAAIEWIFPQSSIGAGGTELAVIRAGMVLMESA